MNKLRESLVLNTILHKTTLVSQPESLSKSTRKSLNDLRNRSSNLFNEWYFNDVATKKVQSVY